MEAQRGSGKVVIVGPSGVGRTTIMHKLVETAAEMGKEIDLSNVEFVEDINAVHREPISLLPRGALAPSLEASIFDSASLASSMLTPEHFFGEQGDQRGGFHPLLKSNVKEAIRKAKAEMRRRYRSGQVT